MNQYNLTKLSLIIMSRYRELKIDNSYTEKEKEFYQTFPYQRSITKYDYTFNQYQREDLDWLAENACEVEYQHLSDTFQTIKEFIEKNLPKIKRIECIPRRRDYFSGYGQTIIKIIALNQTKSFKTRGVVLQQMRDYLNDLPYFMPYTRWDNRTYTYKFHIEEYIIDQIRNNPNLDITINTKNIKIYKFEQSRGYSLLDNIIPIRQEIYHKIKSYLKYQSSKTHFCGITTEKDYVDRQKNLIYQPYDPELTFEWEERYDQCQQTQIHPLENLLFGEKLKLN